MALIELFIDGVGSCYNQRMSAILPAPDHPIAYFCAEFGWDTQVPTYAGGLGVLAGDTLRAAVDADLPMVGVGLLYRGEEAKQENSSNGLKKLN